MFFRFGSAIVLVVLVSLAGVGLEKRNLAYRREISRQRYQTDVLLDRYAKLRWKVQQTSAPVRMIESLEKGELELNPPEKPVEEPTPRMPLLRWQRGLPHAP